MLINGETSRSELESMLGAGEGGSLKSWGITPERAVSSKLLMPVGLERISRSSSNTTNRVVEIPSSKSELESMLGAGEVGNNNFESGDRLSKEIESDLAMIGKGEVGKNNVESDEGASLKEDGSDVVMLGAGDGNNLESEDRSYE
jgi:hypothetical protein